MPFLSPSRRRSLLAVGVLVGILVLGAWRVEGIGWQQTAVGQADHDWPDRPVDHRTASARLADPGGGSTSFMAENDDGTPVTYDPCVPIHLVVNLRTAPPGAWDLVEEAVAAVTSASGLELVLDGPTDELPADDRSPRDGDRWAPVLVAWSDPEETPALSGDVAGIGGSTAMTRDGRAWWVSGAVTLDGPALTQTLAQPGGHEAARAVIMHEIGHLLGLAHVADPGELMHHDNVGQGWWGPGDLSGLARLGAGPCVDY